MPSSKSSSFTLTSSDESFNKSRPTVELLVFHRPAKVISHWWQTLQMLSCFICGISGIAACIALGRIRNAFGRECLLYGEVSLTSSREFHHIRMRDITVGKWGNEKDCNYCIYFPMAGACAAFVLGALFLEFGSSEALLKIKPSFRNDSWKMVVPGILISLVFFIMSCVSLANTVGGLMYFCDHFLKTTSSDLNITSCVGVYSLPWELYKFDQDVAPVDVYTNFLISEIGASLHFVGWFLSLFILVIRFSTAVDFVTVRRIKSPLKDTETIPVFLDGDDEEESDTEDLKPILKPAKKEQQSGKKKKKSLKKKRDRMKSVYFRENIEESDC